MNITLGCPVCGEETEHLILKEEKGRVVRCMRCGHVHRSAVTEATQQKELRIRTIVSKGGDSRVCTTELPSDEECHVGDLLVAECGDTAAGVIITSIETASGRVEKARMRDILTLWSREIEHVIVRVSVHEGRLTLPLLIQTEGEEEFLVGSVHDAGKRRFRISHMKLRDGRVLRERGDRAAARDIKRIYGYRT
ncbi:MAG: HVO_0476 family zinc finger protein [Methanomicrobiales archaeon]|nr:HVO_0476 family zinc finger protein [Methanomicrobiales archaeon]